MEGPTDLQAELNVSRTRITGFEVGIDTVYMGGRIDRVLIARNEPGGGISIGESGFDITKSTITGNTGTEGGGISSGYYANARVTNSTISGNTATVSGGGLFGYVDVKGSTVTRNSAPQGGGFHPYGGVDSASFEGSIVAGNSAPLGPTASATPHRGLEGRQRLRARGLRHAERKRRPHGRPEAWPARLQRRADPHPRAEPRLARDRQRARSRPAGRSARREADGKPDSGSFERR